MTVIHPDPHPGSARAKAAEFGAAADAAAAAVAAPAAGPDMSPVPVTGTPRVAGADDAAFSVTTLDTTNPYARILGQDPQRRQAMVLASSAKVVLCSTKEQAQEVGINGNTGTGAPMAAGVWTPPLTAKSEVWAANLTPATPATVSVIAERYEDPEPH